MGGAPKANLCRVDHNISSLDLADGSLLPAFKQRGVQDTLQLEKQLLLSKVEQRLPSAFLHFSHAFDCW